MAVFAEVRAVRRAKRSESRQAVRGAYGLITLEWLLIVAAIAGLAASSTLAVQRVVDDSTDLPPRRDIRVIDAEIAAAAVAHEANQEIDANPLGYPPQDASFDQRCQDVAAAFDDVVDLPAIYWIIPKHPRGTPPFGPTKESAKCILDRK